jgi:preprotein translocase SecF subunit
MRREIDFVGKRGIFITISLILIVVAVIAIFTKGFNLGVEFTGGTEMIVRIKGVETTESDVRKAVESVGFENARVTRSGLNVPKDRGIDFIITLRKMFIAKDVDEIVKELYTGSVSAEQIFSSVLGNEAKDLDKKVENLKNSFSKIIDTMKKGEDLTPILKDIFDDRAEEVSRKVNSLITEEERKVDLAAAVERKREEIEKFLIKELIEEIVEQYGKEKAISQIMGTLKEKIGGGISLISFTEISGSAAQEVRSGTYAAIIVAIIAILVYITFRFSFIFGIGAIIALVHDVLITLGFYSFTGFEMNVPAVAAILTLIGYSLNDTIVVYDRIRENMKRYRKMNTERLVNRSINEVIVRSINTSLTTFFVVFILLLFAGKTIKSFAFGMTIGTIVGTYSSLYIAAPVVIKWVKRW